MKSVVVAGLVGVFAASFVVACGKKSSKSGSDSGSNANASDPSKIEYYLPGGGSSSEKKGSPKLAADGDTANSTTPPAVASGQTTPAEPATTESPKYDTSQATSSLWRGFCDEASDDTVTILLSANKRFVLKDNGSKKDVFGKTEAASYSGAWLVAEGAVNLSVTNVVDQIGQCDVVNGSINGVDGLSHHLTCSFNEDSSLVRELGAKCSILHVGRDFDVQVKKAKKSASGNTSGKDAATAQSLKPNTEVAEFQKECAGSNIQLPETFSLLSGGLCKWSGFSTSRGCVALRGENKSLVIQDAAGEEKITCSAGATEEDANFTCSEPAAPLCKNFNLFKK